MIFVFKIIKTKLNNFLEFIKIVLIAICLSKTVNNILVYFLDNYLKPLNILVVKINYVLQGIKTYFL